MFGLLQNAESPPPHCVSPRNSACQCHDTSGIPDSERGSWVQLPERSGWRPRRPLKTHSCRGCRPPGKLRRHQSRNCKQQNTLLVKRNNCITTIICDRLMLKKEPKTSYPHRTNVSKIISPSIPGCNVWSFSNASPMCGFSRC